VRAGERPLPAADPTLPDGHHDGTRLPLAAILLALAMAIGGVYLQYLEVLHYGWTLTGIAVFLLGATLRERSRRREPLELVADTDTAHAQGDPRRPDRYPLARPWAYGPIGRYLVGSMTLYHVVGVACWLLPEKDSLDWRKHTHEPFRFWLETTQTTQGWSMFAPNPPRANLFLRVTVTDLDGTTFDMNTDVYHPSQRPIPWVFYTRQRKVNRRIAGAEGGNGEWYQKWHARYYCRKWAVEHGGRHPEKVQLYKVTYPIPTPEHVRDHGPYDPVERMATLSTDKLIYTVYCENELEAQLLNEIRARHGLPASNIPIRRWSELKGKKVRWDNRLERERAEAEAEDAEGAE
jgi:hypothetical protein